MLSNHWPLKKMSACISLLVLTSATGQSAFAEDWIVSHPWIVPDENTPNTSGVGDIPNLVDPQEALGDDLRPLKILYKPTINSDDIVNNSGATLILRTNIVSRTGDRAVHIADGSVDGIIIDDMTVWSMQGASPLKDPSKAAIHIDSSGGDEPALTRGIYSSGNIKGGLYITGQAKPVGGSVYNAVGSSAAGGKATLDGGISVISGGVAESVSDHAIKLENHAYIDYVISGTGSRITAKGENSSAVYVGEGGQLGGAYSFVHQIETLEAVTGAGNDPATGYPIVGDRDNLSLPDDESNYIKVDLNNDGAVDDYDDDGKKDLYELVDATLPFGVSPSINNRSATDTVIAVEGQLTSEQSTAIKIDGNATGQIHITPTGQLSGGLDSVNGSDVPEKSVLWVRKTNAGTGTYTGTVFNEGTVNGGIFIHGTHVSPTDGSLYHGLGTSTDLAELQGGYTVKYGGQATADGRAIHIDRHSTIENVRVVGRNVDTDTGSLLESTNSNAIYVEEDGVVGSAASPTAAAILVSGGAELRGDTGIVVRGTVHGSIHIDDGWLTSSAITEAVAVNFSDADSGLHFKQTGSDSVTTGSIVGSLTNTDDKVEVLDGTLTGPSLLHIDELIVSSKATINLSADFSLPAKTTLLLDEGFDASGPAVSVVGTLSVNSSELTIKPNSLAAYQKLVLNQATTIAVAGGGVDVSGSADDVSTKVTGVPLNYIANTGALIKVTDTVLNTSNNQLEVTVAAVDPSSFTDSLINQSLTETHATLTNMAVSAVASGQNANSEKAKALFQSLNSTTDFETLATQLAEPVEVTARSGIAVMNTTQNIALSEARGQINGFSYGDGFNWGEVWGQAIYSESDQSAVSGKAGFKGKTNGYIVGAGLNVTNNWLAGLSGAITTTNISGDQNKDVKTTSYISSLYSHWDNNDWFFDSLLTLGLSKNDTQKYVGVGAGAEKVEADYDSWLWGARLVAGKQYMMGYWSVAPQLEFNYGHVRFDEYTSRGSSGSESKVQASDYEVMELGGGFRVNSTSWLARGSIRPELSVMGYYDFKNQGSQFESTYLAGGDPFVVTEAERDRFRVQSSIGISMDVWERLTINAAYNHNWSNHYKAHSFSAKANYKF